MARGDRAGLGRFAETELRGRAFPNRVWERGKHGLVRGRPRSALTPQPRCNVAQQNRGEEPVRDDWARPSQNEEGCPLLAPPFGPLFGVPQSGMCPFGLSRIAWPRRGCTPEKTQGVSLFRVQLRLQKAI